METKYERTSDEGAPMSEPELFWKAEDQCGRLEELTGDDREAKDRPLRRDVRSLGMLLGEVILEQAGKAVYDAEEEIRRLAIRNRELRDERKWGENWPGEGGELLGEAARIIAGMSVNEAFQWREREPGGPQGDPLGFRLVAEPPRFTGVVRGRFRPGALHRQR